MPPKRQHGEPLEPLPDIEREIRTKELTGKVLELRRAGAFWKAIGESLGISLSYARWLYGKALAEFCPDELVEDAMRLDLDRLDSVILAHWTNMRRGDPKATQCVLAALDRRARIFGYERRPLSAMVHVEINTADDVDAAFAALIAEAAEIEAMERAQMMLGAHDEG